MSSSSSADLAQARAAALRWLARREYAVPELQQRLSHKGFAESVITVVLEQLQAERLLSNARFVESFVYTRLQQGYGPLRIQHEIRQRGLDPACLAEVEHWHHADWNALARETRARRFGLDEVKDPKARLKQMRFLQGRGFNHDHIRFALALTEWDE